MVKTKTEKQFNKIPLFDSKGKKNETIELDKIVFNGKFNESLLYQAIKMYRANQRKGIADTKTRDEVRGGGKKPWRQKGTGRARVASIRNPIWRGGGVVFGPHPRDFRYHLPKKIRRIALLHSINAKLKSQEIVALEDIAEMEPRTKVVTSILKKMNIDGTVLLIVEKIDRNLALASGNIKRLNVKTESEATALDILSHDRIVITKSVVDALNKRFKI